MPARKRLRAVIDTNVVFSGLTHQGIPNRILRAGEAGIFLWVYSEEIIREYIYVAQDHGFYPELVKVLESLKSIGYKVDVPDILPETFTQISDCQDREVFVAAHVSGALFVTGNHRHFPWSSYRGVRILPPRIFYDLL